MIKKSATFLIVTFMFFITSCGMSAARSGYASQMAPVVAQLSNWKIQNESFESVLMNPTDDQNGISRLEMIELYNMAAEYKITREDYVNMGFVPLDILVGDANKFAREGQSLIDVLGAATPDEGIQAAHQAILNCVQTRAAFAEEVSSSLKNLEPIDLSADTSPCATFDADLEKLTAYVNEHK